MSGQHTPGPWFVVEADSMKYCSVVEFEYASGARGTVGLVGTDGVTVGASDLDEQNANAHLIAAAPALYEALEKAQAALQKAADQFAFYADEHAKKGTPEGDAKGATNMAWARSLAETDHSARAALSLARGETRNG